MTALLNNPDVDIIGVEAVPRIDEALVTTKMLVEMSLKPFYISLCGG